MLVVIGSVNFTPSIQAMFLDVARALHDFVHDVIVDVIIPLGVMVGRLALVLGVMLLPYVLEAWLDGAF